MRDRSDGFKRFESILIAKILDKEKTRGMKFKPGGKSLDLFDKKVRTISDYPITNN